jgi:hypothetical protein
MEAKQMAHLFADIGDMHFHSITRQGIGGIRAAGEECAKGGVRLRGLCPWSGEGPEGQAERSVWLCQLSAEKKPPPRSREKAFPPGTAHASEGKTNPSRNLGLERLDLAAGAWLR